MRQDVGSLRKDGHVNRVGIVRQSVRDRIEGRAIVTGPPLRRMSKCLLCNLDSGPWLTTQAAEVSGLLHITGHHAAAATPLPALLDAAAERDELAGAWDEGHQAGHEDARAVQSTYPEPTPNPYRAEGDPR